METVKGFFFIRQTYKPTHTVYRPSLLVYCPSVPRHDGLDRLVVIAILLDPTHKVRKVDGTRFESLVISSPDTSSVGESFEGTEALNHEIGSLAFLG